MDRRYRETLVYAGEKEKDNHIIYILNIYTHII